MNKTECITAIECIVVGNKSLPQKERNQISDVLQLYADEQSREAFNAARQRIGFEMIHQEYLDFDEWKSKKT